MATGGSSLVNRSYLYCMDTELGWGNRSFFTFFSQFNREATSSVLAGVEATVLVLFFLLSTVSNGVIFYTLSSNSRLRTVTNYFVCNLTLADVCFTLSCPLVAAIRFTGSWTLGSFACKTIIYLSNVCGFVTIWTLMLISIDRYKCIVRSSKRRITPPLALLLIGVIWVVTLAAFSPLLIYFVVKECPFGDGVVSICTLGWPRTPGVSVPVLFTAIVVGLGFLVPSVILVVCHVCIFIKVHKVRVAMAQQRQRRFSTASAALLANHAVWTTHNNKLGDSTNLSKLTSHHHQQQQQRPGKTSLHPNNNNVKGLQLVAAPCRPSQPLLSPSSSTSAPHHHHHKRKPAPLLPLPMALTKSSASTPPTSPTSPSAPSALVTGSNTAPDMSTLNARKRRSSRELQVVKTLVYLVLLFFTLWAPIFVVFLLIMRDAFFDVMKVSSQAFLAAMCVAYANAVLNPLAYGLSTERLRDYLRAWSPCGGRSVGRSSQSPASHNRGVGGACGGAGSADGVSGGGANAFRNGAGRLMTGRSSGGTSMS